jgi:hypothetical protein
MDPGISDFLQNNSSFVEQETMQHESPELTWVNVAIASLFILVNGK